MQKDITAQYNTQGSNYCSNQSENQTCNVLTQKINIFPPKKMYVPPYYNKISSKSERLVERGTHDISLDPHHL